MYTKNTTSSTNFIVGLRAIAIMMVYLVHSGGAGLGQTSEFINTLIFWGRYGVEMFFVISGFTIFYQFYHEKYTAFQFIIVRYLRISIPYYPMLLFCYLLVYFELKEPIYWLVKFNAGIIDIKNLLFHIFYIGAFDLKFINTIIGVEWSLYVEVIAYIIFFVFIGFRIIKFNILNTFIFTIIFFLITIYINDYIKIDPLLFNWSILKYFYMFLLGGTAFLVRERINTFTFIKLDVISNITIFFIGFIFFINIYYNYFTNIELFITILTFLSIIFIRDSSFLSFLLNNKIINFLGLISYSFYLWHMIILDFLFNKLGQGFLLFILSLIMSILISFLWYIIFEKKCYKTIKIYVLKKLGKIT